MKIAACLIGIPAFATAAFLLSAFNASAHPAPSLLAKLHEQRGACISQSGPSLRAKCFEQLADAAIQSIEAASAAPPAPVRGPYDEFVKAAKEAISADLKDPSSTVYRDLFISGSGDSQALCGEMNAKNSYGGYVGFLRFYSTTRPTVQTIEIAGKRHWMNEAWANFCHQKIADIE